MKKILKFFTGDVFKSISDLVDNLFTSDEERLEAKRKIFEVLKTKELELQQLQTEVIVAEAKGNWLQRSWRPILMLAFGFIVVYCKFIGPLFDLKIPVLEDEFWNLLQIGIGGYVIGRTGEKMIKTYSENKK
jgi:hypothetical protein|tara:strand:+ start:122 stop:517 length:396 start_codon:yes stop_codon:yes gene_type:complete